MVGAPEIQHIEVLAGQALNELALGEHLAKPGDVLVQAAIVEAAGAHLTVAGWRADTPSGARFAVVTGITASVPATPWPDLPALALPEQQVRPWLLPAVYDRVRGGKSEFLSELRPAAALFLMFEGIDYDGDEHASAKLDAFVRHIQGVLARYDGALLQLTIGDKGSYLYGAFGAPVAHQDDAARAVAAALELQAPPAEMPFITNIQIGVAYGQMRAGAYGGITHRTYGVLGDKTNLAARLMQVASGSVLCDETIEQAARTSWTFEALPPIRLKGKARPVAVYRPLSKTPQSASGSRIDELDPAHQLTLKVASVIGQLFSVDVLHAIYPGEADRVQLEEQLEALSQLGLVTRHLAVSRRELSYLFVDPSILETSYNRLLFAQRRQLHRAMAEWHERLYAGDLAPYYALLAEHWSKAEDMAKAIVYLERAGEQAQQRGDYDEAIRYINESLALIAASSDPK